MPVTNLMNIGSRNGFSSVRPYSCETSEVDCTEFAHAGSGRPARSEGASVDQRPNNICIWAGETRDLSCALSVFIGTGVAKVIGQAHLRMAHSLG